MSEKFIPSIKHVVHFQLKFDSASLSVTLHAVQAIVASDIDRIDCIDPQWDPITHEIALEVYLNAEKAETEAEILRWQGKEEIPKIRI